MSVRQFRFKAHLHQPQLRCRHNIFREICGMSESYCLKSEIGHITVQKHPEAIRDLPDN